MGIFSTLTRRSGTATSGPWAGSDGAGVASHQGRPADRPVFPARFEAVGEALAAERDPGVACSVVGHEMARDGVDLGEALRGLRATCLQVTEREPEFTAVQSLSLAWSEETLAYLHQLSCEDPLTGLASHAHVRARLGEVYRGGEQGGRSAQHSHALVVVDLPLLDSGHDRFSRALWLVRLAETVRSCFDGGETVAQLGTKLVVLTDRGTELGRRVAELRELVTGLGECAAGARVWIEGLPGGIDSAARLLDELARS